MDRQRKLEQLMLENDLKINRAQYDQKSDAEKKDLIDKFKDKLTSMRNMFKGDDPDDK